MKKLIGFLFIMLVLYSVYNDFNRGSLPAAVSENKIEAKTQDPEKQVEQTAKHESKIPYFEKEIFPGDTVLSVLESELNEPIPVPISEVISDFEKLNSGLSPEDIKFGKTYKFPDYQTVQ